MDAVKFITTMSRICAVDHCRDCALNFFCQKVWYERTKDDVEKAEKLVEKWLKDHPVKTHQSELLKMFPNTPVDCNSGVIAMCPASFDASACKQGVSCDDCRREFWSKEVE